jgi:hypothetical protein
MRRVLLAAGFILLFCGCANQGGSNSLILESRAKIQFETGADVGYCDVYFLDVDNGDTWNSMAFRPFFKAFTYREGLSWDFNAGIMYSTEDEVEDTTVLAKRSGYDIAYRMGWGIKVTPTTKLNILGGMKFRYARSSFNRTILQFSPVDYQTETISGVLGARIEQHLGGALRLTGELTGDFPFSGRAEMASTSTEAIGRLDNGFGFEGRGGIEFKLKENLRIGAGGFVDFNHYEWEGDWVAEDEFWTVGGYLSLIFRF